MPVWIHPQMHKNLSVQNVLQNVGTIVEGQAQAFYFGGKDQCSSLRAASFKFENICKASSLASAEAQGNVVRAICISKGKAHF
jgi:collagenase-like PrtC family protease